MVFETLRLSTGFTVAAFLRLSSAAAVSAFTVALVFVVALAFAAAPAAHAYELSMVGYSKGAASLEIDTGAGLVYVGAGSTMKVFESGAEPPLVQLGDFRVHSLIHDLKLADGVLFVAANNDGVWALDVTDPGAVRSLAHVVPVDEEAAYDITVVHATLYVATPSNVTVYRLEGDALTRIGAFGWVEGTDYVTGCDVRGSTCAVTVSTRSSGGVGSRNGVFFYDRFTGEEAMPFYHQEGGFPEDVLFPEDSGDAIFVLGGGNILMMQGYFYILDLRGGAPVKSQEFLVQGVFPGFDMVSVFNAASRNDTLFVTTTGGWDFGEEAAGVWVFDCTDPFDVSQIAWVPQGLLYFDTALDGNLLHVASEWYGVVTVDITDLDATEILGNTVTGGWNVATAVNGDWVVNALEGYGFEILDISDPAAPEVLTHDDNPGFCNSIAFSEDRSLVFGGYLSTGGFRIFDVTGVGGGGDPVLLSNLQNITAAKRIAPVGDRVYVARPINGVTRIDISDPSNPRVCCTGSIFLGDHQDIVAHGDSVIAACGGRIQAFLFTDDAATQAGNIIPPWFWFTSCDAVAWRDGNIWVPWQNKGVYRYEARFEGGEFVFTEAASRIESGDYGYITVDEKYVYVLRKTEGRMLVLDRETLEQVAGFTASGGYRDLPFYGVTDVKEQDGFVFVTDYFSQLNIVRKPGGRHILPWKAR